MALVCPYCKRDVDLLKGGGYYNPADKSLAYDFSNEPSACRACWPDVFGSRIPRGAARSLNDLNAMRAKARPKR